LAEKSEQNAFSHNAQVVQGVMSAMLREPVTFAAAITLELRSKKHKLPRITSRESIDRHVYNFKNSLIIRP
jgi:hypothetical protein